MSTKAHHPVVPLGVYIKVLISLLILTVLTVYVAQFDFGAFNSLVAMLIATMKAALVAAFFMHLKYDDRMLTVILLTGVFFLILMWGFSFLDIVTRVPEQSTL